MEPYGVETQLLEQGRGDGDAIQINLYSDQKIIGIFFHVYLFSVLFFFLFLYFYIFI